MKSDLSPFIFSKIFKIIIDTIYQWYINNVKRQENGKKTLCKLVQIIF